MQKPEQLAGLTLDNESFAQYVYTMLSQMPVVSGYHSAIYEPGPNDGPRIQYLKNIYQNVGLRWINLFNGSVNFGILPKDLKAMREMNSQRLIKVGGDEILARLTIVDEESKSLVEPDLYAGDEYESTEAHSSIPPPYFPRLVNPKTHARAKNAPGTREVQWYFLVLTSGDVLRGVLTEKIINSQKVCTYGLPGFVDENQIDLSTADSMVLNQCRHDGADIKRIHYSTGIQIFHRVTYGTDGMREINMIHWKVMHVEIKRIGLKQAIIPINQVNEGRWDVEVAKQVHDYYSKMKQAHSQSASTTIK